MSGRYFVLIAVDCGTSEFAVEGPMTDDHPWNIAAANAHYLGQNIRCFGMGDITPDAAAAEWRAAFGRKRLAAGSLLSPEIHPLQTAVRT